MSRVCVTGAVLCVLVAAMHAQDGARSIVNGGENGALTVDEAVREALDRNLALAAERYGVSVARARVVTASLRPNPVLTVNAVLPDATAFDSSASPREQVVRADYLFETAGKRARRIDVAQAAASVAELQLVDAIRTTVLEVESAFVDAQLAKANVALARESLGAFNELVRVNTERLRTGDLAQVELTRSMLAALQFQNDVRQQESALRLARNRLRTLVGRTGPSPLDTQGDFRRDADPGSENEVRRRALSGRPDYQALQVDRSRSAADLRLQIAQGKVDYTLSGEFHRQQQPLPANRSGHVLGLFVSAPLPVFNRNQGEIARARTEGAQIDARISALAAQIADEVSAAYEHFTSSRAILDAVERGMLEPARQVRTATEYSYRRGEASFVEFLDAVRAFNETMQSYNEARAAYARSLYALDAVSGRATP